MIATLCCALLCYAMLHIAASKAHAMTKKKKHNPLQRCRRRSCTINTSSYPKLATLQGMHRRARRQVSHAAPPPRNASEYCSTTGLRSPTGNYLTNSLNHDPLCQSSRRACKPQDHLGEDYSAVRTVLAFSGPCGFWYCTRVQIQFG